MTVPQAWQEALLPALAVLVLTVVLTRLVLAWLHHKQILDHPNERSSHTLPTPRGGGLAVTPVVALAWAWLGNQYGDPLALGAALAAFVLLGLSWLDDRKGLPPLPRFLAMALTVGGGLALLWPELLVFGGLLPLWADRLVAALGWLWFINLYNFMDGIDGITGVETASLGIGVALVATLAGAVQAIPLALMAAAAGLGFLVWNWHPAKIFLGDSGSVPLGYLLGLLLIMLAASGQLAAALILPAYYLADATITLLWRLKDGEKVWQAHRRHFYQRAVQGGKTHAQVSRTIALANVGLIACAVLAALGHTLLGGGTALLIVALLLAALSRWAAGCDQGKGCPGAA
jgi:UDP-N-acetylmuramyl pentapeptide phosphotransferase/UDP-N-acetylglucosamine-1-phosphate transferase